VVLAILGEKKKKNVGTCNFGELAILGYLQFWGTFNFGELAKKKKKKKKKKK